MAYRGKHRKPTQAGKNAARVATASVVALAPIVASVPAHAGTAPLNQLAELLRCESGGDPMNGRINWTRENEQGSSASGAYQIIDSTWIAFGGGQYSQRAKDATPRQQTEVAARIAREAGVSQWSCAGRAGFTDPSAITWTNVLALTGEVTLEQSVPEVQVQPDPVVPEQTVPTPQVEQAPREQAPSEPRELTNPYVVRDGDTLSWIAQDFSLEGWSNLYAVNRDVVGDDPDLIFPGQSLVIPQHEATSVQVAPVAEVAPETSAAHEATSDPSNLAASVSAALSASEAVSASLTAKLSAASASGYGGVAPHVARAGHVVAAEFGVSTVLGVGPRPRKSDHSSGLALDFMVSEVTGNQLADFVLNNASELNVSYVIWRQRINYGNGWVKMDDRGSDTENHYDHVHVSFNN